jgi:hypothetical protein
VSGWAYPAAVRRRAVELVSGRWSAPEASDVLFAETGVRVHPKTIARWNDNETAAFRREQQREAARLGYAVDHGGRLGSVRTTPQTKLARIRGLMALGLPAAKVATVLNFDFPDDRLDADDVFWCLQHDRYLPARSAA